MNEQPKPVNMESIEEIRARERASVTPNTGEASEETRKSLAEVDEMLTQNEWDAKIAAAKAASGDISAMIKDAAPIQEGDKPLDPNAFVEGEDVDLSGFNQDQAA